MAGQAEARDAIYQAIEETVTESRDWAPGQRAEVLRDLALAYRYVLGGPQPGSTQVSS
jgi:hypothetical protein